MQMSIDCHVDGGFEDDPVVCELREHAVGAFERIAAELGA